MLKEGKRSYQDFKKARRHQSYGKHRYPGATTIIGNNIGWNKNVLTWWHGNEVAQGRDPKESMRVAAEIGTLSHYFVECWLKDQEPEDIDEYGAAFIEIAEKNLKGFQKWAKAYKFEWYKSESHYSDDDLCYGGAIDLLCIVDGEKAVGDMKTSKAIYPEHKIQGVAYSKLVEKNEGIELPVVFIQMRNGRVMHHWLDDEEYAPCWIAFTAALDLHQVRKEISNF